MTGVRLRSDALHWRQVEEQVVAIDVVSRQYLAVNRTGTVLWPALLEGTTPDALSRLLVERFEIDDQTAARDVEVLLADLRARGLLEP